MKIYEKPMAQIRELNSEDIIMTSGNVDASSAGSVTVDGTTYSYSTYAETAGATQGVIFEW